ncbi:CDT1 Geminin-binding domain-containing protein [Cinnamomum micranthum f. kanehirae]|uniref:CDT1 Geminin-binding domain-containing protein n=1 Tax=Cinnamomum micranthum f. kanehirae TaxID=337451 RepID=A0A3S3N8P3_9MAGN|nr:CDT1 Geminin-binding domain-containing protein [Cinnamomum micranthum f. kanehirae]
MEHNSCEESRQNTVDVKCEMVLFDVEKSSSSLEATVSENAKIDEEWGTGNSFASPTPEKTPQPPRSKNRGNALPVGSVKQIGENFQEDNAGIPSADEDTTKDNSKFALASEIPDSSLYAVIKFQKHERNTLPDKYKIIADLFDRVVTSVKLLSLRGKLCSFLNVSIQVEILTKRKFLYSHLAQIKYLFPEAIQIDKILIHDVSTLCMKPDMKITLLAGEFEGHPDQSGSLTLRKLFHERLMKFFNAHPEGDDIPEALLPEPFNQRNDAILLESLPLGSSSELPQPSLAESGSLINSSHLCPSFCKQFSQKIVPETETTPLLGSPVPLLSVTTATGCHRDSRSPIKNENISTSANIMYLARPKITPDKCRNPSFSESTPSKPVPFSTPIKSTKTPAQPTPKRSMPSPDGDDIVETGISTHFAPKRSLIFSDNEANLAVSGFDMDRDLYDTSIQVAMPGGSYVAKEIMKSSSTVESVHGRTGLSKRQQMLACLPALFNVIQLIFQSLRGSSITKQELIHKIIWQSVDIVETEEVEEQLELLEELVPDWIYRKIVSSGDFLYCVRKTSEPNTVLERLVKAT